jgi:hypothetical protein
MKLKMNSVLSAPDVFGTLHQLLAKTRLNRIKWSAEPNRVRAELASASISLQRDPNSEDSFTLSLLSSDGETVWSTTINRGDHNVVSLLRELYEIGTTSAVAAVFQQINQDLASEEPSSGVTTTTPPPARPTNEKALRLFEMVKGRWHLDYGRGQEEIEIDEAGNLYIVKASRGKDVAREIKPRYRLELLECDENLRHIELAKVDLTGRVRQIEVLDISPEKMKGVAKHDGHQLVYQRVG